MLTEKGLRKAGQRERRYIIERLFREKRSEEMDVLEEVFDKPTLMIIYRMLNNRKITRVCGVVRSGKESRIYLAKGIKTKDIALKVYLTTSAEFRKGMLTYIEGDPRFHRVKSDARSTVYLWARKEFKNLHSAYSAGVRVPKPLCVEGNVLAMEFIGKDGEPAPLLKDTKLRSPNRIYKKILGHVTRLYRKAGLVHGDLSEYNIMIWKGEPVLFDFSQSVTLEHPMVETFLRRDILNLNIYFAAMGINVVPLAEAYDRVVKKTD